jgi:hypothetical protein
MYYKKKQKLIFFLSFLTLFLSLYFNEDGYGRGASGDLRDTWGYIENIIKNNFKIISPLNWTLHFPLHYYIISFLHYIIGDQTYIRVLFCVISIFVPCLFIIIYKKINNNLSCEFSIILASIIFFIPGFRYTSIWANNNITSTIFFLVSIFFFYLWKTNYKKKNSFYFILFQITFLILACYTRQYYCVFFFYFFYYYFKKINNYNLFVILVFTFFLSIPGFLYVYYYPELFTKLSVSTKFSNSLLGNSSMLSIYFIPILLINFFLNKKIFVLKEVLFVSIFSFLITLILSLNFDDYNWLGGGIIFFISNNILKNNFLFYCSSALSIAVLLFIAKENIPNLILVMILLFTFSGNAVYQRYFEPLFYIIYFLLVHSKTSLIFKKNINSIYLLFVFYLIYYSCALLSVIH